MELLPGGKRPGNPTTFDVIDVLQRTRKGTTLMSTVLKRMFLPTVLVGFLMLGYGGHLAMAGLIKDLIPNSSNSVKLSELLDGTYDSVTVGDKVFDEFVYDTTGIDMPNADNVNVLGVDLDGNLGISFHGSFMDLPGDGPSNAAIMFTVEVSEDAQAADWRISDAHLLLGAPGVGESSIFRVDESFGVSSNKALHVISSTLGSGEQVLSDWIDFDAPLNKLRVTKGIFALAGNDSSTPALASVVSQTFSQVQVPEPTTLSLLTMSLVGALLASRDRRG
jgi:hypothetical protein